MFPLKISPRAPYIVVLSAWRHTCWNELSLFYYERHNAAVLNLLTTHEPLGKFLWFADHQGCREPRWFPGQKKFQFTPSKFPKDFFGNYTQISIYPQKFPNNLLFSQLQKFLFLQLHLHLYSKIPKVSCNFYVYTIPGPVCLLSIDWNERNILKISNISLFAYSFRPCLRTKMVENRT